jgi:CheY-like chemotaxis protein
MVMARDDTILIAEDSADYAMFMKMALRGPAGGKTVHFVENGEDVIHYLEGRAKYSDRNVFAFPALLLLDLKMPGLDGFDVLRWMVQNSDRRVIPTIVLSSSVLERDVKDAYALGATAYLGKPADLNDLKTMLDDLFKFWAWSIRPEMPLG